MHSQSDPIPRMRRRPTRMIAERPPQRGPHPKAWLAEFVGTAAVLAVGVSAISLDFGSHSPFRLDPMSLRLLLTGLVFAATGSIFSVTPLGRLSGAHLNPVVTLAFWSQRKAHWNDVVGFIAAQLLGALFGTAVARLIWGSQAISVEDGATQPGAGTAPLAAVGIEAGMTALVILTILLMTSSAAVTRFTPVVLWLMIAALVWLFAPYTGTSLNPARSLGPALLAPLLDPYWIYVAGPLLGGAVAVGAFALMPGVTVLTTKLFHDPRYPSSMATTLVVAAAKD